MIDDAACLDCGHRLSICEHAAQRLVDPMVGFLQGRLDEMRAERDAARAEAQAIRAACVEEGCPGEERQCALCLVCWPTGASERHEDDCILAHDPDRTGRELLAAADALADAVARTSLLMRPEEVGAIGYALAEYRRLRGDRTTASREDE